MREVSKNKERTCLHCYKDISLLDKANIFCSRSCSASYNNQQRRDVKKINCKFCGVEHIPARTSTGIYCSNKCQIEDSYKEKVNRWLKQGGNLGKTSLKRYLTEKHGYKCSCCGISKWNEKPLVLEVDHIDGNSYNNNEDNLRLICPNCHSQTDTYKAKNKGNGRDQRMTRYKEGLSY